MVNPVHDRYLFLDAWRGLAALGVVLFHLGIGSNIALGHAAVLVFFVISGYCIAASAESCQRNHVGAGGYMWRRLRRIYPPYFFSICYFLATRLLKANAGLGNQISRSATGWIQNLSLTQWLTLVRHPASSPFDNPTLFVAGYWSLNYEEQFYIVVGLLLVGAFYLRTSLLPLFAWLALPAFLWNVFHPAMVYGFFLEYWVNFVLGSLVFYRLCRLNHHRLRHVIDAGIGLLLLLAVLQSYSHSGHGRTVYFEWMIAGSFALVLLYTRRWDETMAASWLGRGLRMFGATSYSLYLTQQCNLGMSAMVAGRLIRWGIPSMAEVPIRLAFICGVGTAFWYCCERPFLNKPLKHAEGAGQRSTPIQASA
jgi:peptidoglycan/LPS O-acetylase OafA/YrhL